MSMTFDTKFAVVLRDDLLVWQKLNITAFIAGAVVGGVEGLIGEPYRDASGNEYHAMSIQPIMIYQADAAALRKAFRRGMERQIKLAIFTADLFTTGNDIDNRAAVADKPIDALDLVGIALRDDKRTVDAVIKGLKLHS